MSDPARSPPPDLAFVSLPDFEARARSRLSFALPQGFPRTAPSVRGDHSLDGTRHPAHPHRPAAVLIAVATHADGPTIILTERARGMRDHAGQIAFPGGKIDASDPSPLDAALREAEEEIGLDRSHLDPIGYLDPYVTGTGYVVVPTLALVEPPFRLAPDPREVADAFEVPLRFLMNAANHQRHSRDIGGRSRQFYAMPFERRFIWGATAGMLRDLYERLYG